MGDNLRAVVSLIKNIHSIKMNMDLIGFSIEEIADPIDSKEVEKFLHAIKENNSTYLGAEGIVPHFFLSKLIFPLIRRIVVHKDLNLNLLKMVHGEQEGFFYMPVKVGDVIKSRSTIKNIRKTPAGEILEVYTECFRDDDLVAKTVSGFLVRNKKISLKKKIRRPRRQKEIFKYDIQTFEGQQLEYAKASDDKNFIHTNEVLVKLAGLPRTIMHGLCVLAMTCSEFINNELKGDIKKPFGFKVRFAAPALPGQKLTLYGYKKTTGGNIPFILLNSSGKPVLKKGMFILKK